MAISDVHLISKCGNTLPSTVSLDVGAVATNLSFVDRELKKAGRPELKPFFESDDQTWWPPGDVLSAWENARTFFAGGPENDVRFQVVAEQLDQAADVLRTLPADAVMRLEIIKSAPKKSAKSVPKTPARPRSSALAAARATSVLIPGATKSALKLTATQREYVQSLLEDYRCDADLWTFPDIERKKWLSEIDEQSGLNSLECLRQNVRRQQQQLNDEECEALVEMDLFTIDLARRGLARRISFNLLSDLRTSLSLSIRIKWLERRTYRRKGASYEDAWIILRALAVKDVAVARHLLDFSDEPLSGAGHPPGKLLYNTLFAIFRQDQKLQNKLVGQLAKQKTPEAYKAVLNVLGGILTEDPPTIAAGLTQVLATFRRIPLNDDEKVICLVAHGLAELALKKNGKLLDNFDVAQEMPWDAAFFQWVRNESSSPVYPELARQSVLLDKWLNHFEIPASWGVSDERE